MNFYLDASASVSLFVTEASSEQAWKWLRSKVEDDIYISPWVLTEVSSALSMKVRTKALSLEQRADAMTNWRAFSKNLPLITIQNEDYEIAARFADQHHLSLRASDALHIAVAYGASCQLVTLDKRMAAAAIQLGVPVADI